MTKHVKTSRGWTMPSMMPWRKWNPNVLIYKNENVPQGCNKANRRRLACFHICSSVLWAEITLPLPYFLLQGRWKFTYFSRKNLKRKHSVDTRARVDDIKTAFWDPTFPWQYRICRFSGLWPFFPLVVRYQIFGQTYRAIFRAKDEYSFSPKILNLSTILQNVKTHKNNINRKSLNDRVWRIALDVNHSACSDRLSETVVNCQVS
jgi:hypothetical protein